MERESLCIAKGILITGVERMEYGIGEPPARASFFSLFGDGLHLCQYGRRTGYKRAALQQIEEGGASAMGRDTMTVFLKTRREESYASVFRVCCFRRFR